MNDAVIKRIVNRGIRSLGDSIGGYWPAGSDKNDMSERNITAHVGHSFLKSGWLIFTEVPFPRPPSQRLDMLALNRGSKVSIAIESKNLYGGDKARQLAGDAKRIRKFRLIEEYAEFNPRQRFGLLLAFTWQHSIQKWWAGRDHGLPPEGCARSGWTTLGKRLDDYGTVCGSRKVQAPDYPNFWALHAIYKIKN
jgi:hypothetical protein